MPRKLKVFGGNIFWNAGEKRDQVRAIVYAPTKKRACEILNELGVGRFSMHKFNNYWCETGNKQEMSLDTEEAIWYTDDRYGGDRKYIKIYPKPV